ncbi:MAG: C45 family peptidase [Saprospiraceae bacterium]
MKGLKKWMFYIFLLILFLVLGLWIFLKWVEADPPKIEDKSALKWERKIINDSTYQVKNNFLSKNQYGLWDMYLEGKPFERGVASGMMTKEILDYQEFGFVSNVDKKVPNPIYQYFLKLFVAWFDKDLPKYVPEEYLEEIYGLSHFAADEYDYIGPKFHRKLNYHAAHDIGHALQNMGLVAGCSALAAWNENSVDSNLILGRNFDFYVGDEFAKNKIILFMRPEEGIPFGMVTWPGFAGSVSGMNLKGLTVTLNAAPSGIPTDINTPVAILARKILQYASNIEEAKEISKSYTTFVSELFLIGSGDENKICLIEKTPDTTIFYNNEKDFLALSNHFQSDFLKNSEENLAALKNTSTLHRFNRINELFQKNKPLSLQNLAKTLRDTKGVGGENIGLGSEMAVNQMYAHHSIILKPGERKMWVAANPDQCAQFVAYDLNEIFNSKYKTKAPLCNTEETLDPDSLVYTSAYKDFLVYRKLAKKIENATGTATVLKNATIDSLIELNPQLHLAYAIGGEYYLSKNEKEKAKELFKEGLNKKFPWTRDSLRLVKDLELSEK